jgi:hypothetical protein
MLQELQAGEFERALSLFHGFDYSLSLHAAIEGNNPGRIFVDAQDDPRTGLALTVEGYLLAGDDSNPEANEALRHLFAERIFTGEVFVNGDDSVSLAVHPETWEALSLSLSCGPFRLAQPRSRGVRGPSPRSSPVGRYRCRLSRSAA